MGRTIPAEDFNRVMEQMKIIMDRIDQNLGQINDRICILEERVDQISKETKKMDEHVDYVSNLYNQVKVPFHYLIDYVSHLTSREDATEEIESTDQLSITYQSSS